MIGGGGEHAKKEDNTPKLVKKGEEDPYAPKGEAKEGEGEAHADVDGDGGSEYKTSYYNFTEDFTSNLKNSPSLVQISLACSTHRDGRVLLWLRKHELAIRSEILVVLADTPEEDAFTPAGKQHLQKRLTGAINKVLTETEGFEQADCQLPRVALQVWRGNVFISLAREPVPFEKAMADFEDEFAALHTERCRVAHVASFDLRCNWKFFHENLMDFYHVRVLHGKTFGRFFSWTPENVSLKDSGGISIRYDAAPSTPEGKTLFDKAPWLADRGNEFACTGFMPPNLTLFGRIDCVKLMSAWPTGVDSCRVFIYLLFPAEFHADPDFERKVAVYTDYQARIYEEDRSMIESMQRAMALPVYEPGRMSVMEKPIHHFLMKYEQRMFGASKEHQ